MRKKEKMCLVVVTITRTDLQKILASKKPEKSCLHYDKEDCFSTPHETPQFN